MSSSAKSFLYIGILILLLTILNSLIAPEVNPSLQRAEILAAIASVSLMLVAFLWTEVSPIKKTDKKLKGSQGLIINENLTQEIRDELGWGSQLLLTATPAATILVYWDNNILLHRGILGPGNFTPESTCLEAQNKQKLVYLANTSLYPNTSEFDPILEELPSILIYPLFNRGWVILGGNTIRCFSKSDEKWLKGWSDRLYEILNARK